MSESAKDLQTECFPSSPYLYLELKNFEDSTSCKGVLGTDRGGFGYAAKRCGSGPIASTPKLSASVRVSQTTSCILGIDYNPSQAWKT